MRAGDPSNDNRRSDARRQRTHAKRVRLLAQWAASFPDGRNDRQALLLGGAPADQASVWEQAMLEATGIPEPHWFSVGGDDFQDGALQGMFEDEPFVSPEQLTIDRLLSTSQLAPLLRDEVLGLREAALRSSIAEGRNLVVADAMGEPEPAGRLLLRLEQADYTVRIAAVDGPSLCLKVAYRLAEVHGCVTELSAFEPSTTGESPQLLERRGRSAPGGILLDHEAYSAIATGLPPVNQEPFSHAAASAARPRPRREPHRRPEHGRGR